MNRPVLLLTALQHGDSFFPSGAISFSWGLETLYTDGEIQNSEHVARFIEGQLRYRWASNDRAFLVSAYRAGDDLAEVCKTDRFQEAMSLPRELREGSKRAGRALLSVHDRLHTANAREYRNRVLDGEAPGHLSVIQGLVFKGVGLDLESAVCISAHGLCVGLLGAALRLNIIGHIDGQKILSQLRESIADTLTGPEPSLEDANVYGPAVDIAVMRHEFQELRLFSN